MSTAKPSKVADHALQQQPRQSSRDREPAAESASPWASVLFLQRAAGNRAVSDLLHPLLASGDMPSAVRSVLWRSSGVALDPAVRQSMELHFGCDFDDVRIHAGGLAARSAHDLGALAYGVGSDIVFAPRRFAPETANGRRLLAHELAHVVQSRTRSQAGRRIVPRSDPSEVNADRATSGLTAGPVAPTLGTAPAAVRLTRDPGLDAVLGRIRQIPTDLSVADAVRRVGEAVQRVDLADPDNLRPITVAIAETFPGERGRDVLTTFLRAVEATVLPEQPVSQEPTPEQQAHMERQMQRFQVQRRGPYGQHGPGVLLPVLSQAARPLLPVAEALGHAYSSAGGFVQGLYDGLSGSVSPQQLAQLSRRLLASSALQVVFAPVFVAGAAYGIAEDLIEAVKGIIHTITNFTEMLAAAKEFIAAMFSPEGAGIARRMGVEIGREYGERITRLLDGNIFLFNFNLGRLIGPTIVYTILAFLGVPEAIASALITRLLQIARPLLQRLPRLARLVEVAAGRLAHRRRRIDPDIDRMVEQGITEHPGPPTSRPASRPRPRRPASNARSAAARERFNSLRDGYAQRLGVGPGGQVHHGIELQALDRYPGVFTDAELNAFPNMRGIPAETAARRQLHNSKIREVWDRHYRGLDDQIAQRGLTPGTPAYNSYVRQYLTAGRDEMDHVLGQFFSEYRTGRPRSFQ